MRMGKAIARFALAAVLVLGLTPATAFAQEKEAGDGSALSSASACGETSAAFEKAAASLQDGPAADGASVVGEAAVNDGAEADARADASTGEEDGELYVMGVDMFSYAMQVVDLVNQERTAAGLGALTPDTELMAAAMQRSAEVSTRFSHERPNGASCFTVSSKAFGENIAAGQMSPEAVMNSWMNSDGHRANIMNSGYGSIGVGCFMGIDGTLNWVQLFGRSATDPFDVVPDDMYDAWPVDVDPAAYSVQLHLLAADSEDKVSAGTLDAQVGDEYVLGVFGVGEDGGWTSTFLVENPRLVWDSTVSGMLGASANGNLEVTASGSTRLTAKASGLQASIDITARYSDAAPGEWYEGAVDYASQKGLISGYGGTSEFGVGDVMTRAQLATILWRHAEPDAAAAYDGVAGNETGLPDVAANQYWTAAANWAVDNGVINGVARADGSRAFDPDGAVTREQLATILANFNGVDAGSYDAASLSSFPDVADVDGWAAGGMAWAVDNGVVSGVDEGGVRYLRATAPVPREQAAAVLMNAIEGGVL